MARKQAQAGHDEPVADGAPQVSARRPYIIGIGASAEDPQALVSLVRHLPPAIEAALVVVPQLQPTPGGVLAHAISDKTALRVELLESDQIPQCGAIYVAPPESYVQLKDGKLAVHDLPPHALPGAPLDVLLESLAEERGEDAVGVVLAGEGTDGANGIRAIKAAGGFTLAQDPRTAERGGMPQAAIDTGCADRVLSPQDIARDIALLCEVQPARAVDGDRPDPSQTSLARLLAMVGGQTRIDFSGYSEATIWRRVERRRIASRTPGVEEYLHFAERVPGELERLAKDFLSSVTSFFRDRDVFAALERHVGELVARKHDGEDIRVWVPGCATGEEAYSLAIVFHRVLGARFERVRLQVFATDVDMDALQIGRRGVYTAATLNGLDRGLIRQYFRPAREGYAVIEAIHDVVVFARQDVALDPPYLRLDLISCRNLLIYRKAPLQAKILSLFHYALLPDGLLLLGRSERVTQVELLFAAKDSACIFSRRPPAGAGRPSPATG